MTLNMLMTALNDHRIWALLLSKGGLNIYCSHFLQARNGGLYGSCPNVMHRLLRLLLGITCGGVMYEHYKSVLNSNSYIDGSRGGINHRFVEGAFW